jgi:hypothetical protein
VAGTRDDDEGARKKPTDDASASGIGLDDPFSGAARPRPRIGDLDLDLGRSEPRRSAAPFGAEIDLDPETRHSGGTRELVAEQRSAGFDLDGAALREAERARRFPGNRPTGAPSRAPRVITRSRWPRRLGGLLVLAALGGAGWWAWKHFVEARVATVVVGADSPSASRFAGFVVRSTPAGARVLVDDREVGTTPVTVTDLLPVRHVVRIEAEGHESITRARNLLPGQLAVIDVRLVPLSAPP